ncbi:MAG TPA: hypothetical protein VFS67_20630 [Polyangiaceae bacterium]|nr:hypothetical protein [Polyangiaceae bacterium]
MTRECFCAASTRPARPSGAGFRERSHLQLARAVAHRTLGGNLEQVRRFSMTTQGLSEDEAISLISVGVDFGVTQVVDGNWGVPGIIEKQLFSGES